jgi:hypothetical protein
MEITKRRIAERWEVTADTGQVAPLGTRCRP